MRVLSLNIETSASDLRGGILSIGLVKCLPEIPENKPDFYAQIHYPEGIFCRPEAMLVNKLTFEGMNDRTNPNLEEVDQMCCDFIGLTSDDKWIPMGRGIGYFDMMFIERDLPRFFKRLNRRLFDLTGWMMGLAVTHKKNFHKLRDAALDYATEKMNEKTLEQAQLEPARAQTLSSMGRHHALWDAWHNIFAMQFLQQEGVVL